MNTQTKHVLFGIPLILILTMVSVFTVAWFFTGATLTLSAIFTHPLFFPFLVLETLAYIAENRNLAIYKGPRDLIQIIPFLFKQIGFKAVVHLAGAIFVYYLPITSLIISAIFITRALYHLSPRLTQGLIVALAINTASSAGGIALIPTYVQFCMQQTIGILYLQTASISLIRINQMIKTHKTAKAMKEAEAPREEKQPKSTPTTGFPTKNMFRSG